MVVEFSWVLSFSGCFHSVDTGVILVVDGLLDYEYVYYFNSCLCFFKNLLISNFCTALMGDLYY